MYYAGCGNFCASDWGDLPWVWNLTAKFCKMSNSHPMCCGLPSSPGVTWMGPSVKYGTQLFRDSLEITDLCHILLFI